MSVYGEEERCVACDAILEKGEMVYHGSPEGGYIHANCAGDDPESFVDENEEHLKPGDPLPKPFEYTGD